MRLINYRFFSYKIWKCSLTLRDLTCNTILQSTRESFQFRLERNPELRGCWAMNLSPVLQPFAGWKRSSAICFQVILNFFSFFCKRERPKKFASLHFSRINLESEKAAIWKELCFRWNSIWICFMAYRFSFAAIFFRLDVAPSEFETKSWKYSAYYNYQK